MSLFSPFSNQLFSSFFFSRLFPFLGLLTPVFAPVLGRTQAINLDLQGREKRREGKNLSKNTFRSFFKDHFQQEVTKYCLDGKHAHHRVLDFFANFSVNFRARLCVGETRMLLRRCVDTHSFPVKLFFPPPLSEEEESPRNVFSRIPPIIASPPLDFGSSSSPSSFRPYLDWKFVT